MAQAAVTPGVVVGERTAPAAGPPAGLERPDFEIVPRRGLPIVGVILVAVIVAVAANKLWPLMFLHVVGGASWTVIDLFLGFVLGPILGSMPIPARVALTTRLMPKMVLIMPTAVIVTLTAGWQLGTHLGTVQSSYYLHGWVVASYIVVGVMAVIALGLLEPANIAVLTELKKPQPRPEVIERLMKRFIYTAGATGVMQIATFVIMTKLASG
jgi:MFS family permease